MAAHLDLPPRNSSASRSTRVGPGSSPTVWSAPRAMGGGVSPGELVAIFGSGIGPNTLAGLQLDSAGNVVTTLGGVQVFFDGIAAPLVYVFSTQVSAIVPYAVSGKTSTQVQVVVQNQKSNIVTVPVTAAAPGIFTLDSSGRGAGAILNQNGTVNFRRQSGCVRQHRGSVCHRRRPDKSRGSRWIAGRIARSPARADC